MLTMGWWLAGLAFAVMAVGVVMLVRDPYRVVRFEYIRQRLAFGFKRVQTTLEGTRWVHVERAASQIDAPTLVMVHGYTGSKENWYRLAAQLKRRYRLIAPDLPGWGESERRSDLGHGYAAQADRVAAFVRAVAGGQVVLLGHSMGGGVAAVVAARHPGLVSHLVLLDAAGVEFSENRFARAVVDGGNPFAITDMASLEQYLSILFHERRSRPPMPWPAGPALVAHRRGESGFEQSVLNDIGRSDAAFLPSEEATQIRQPTLLVWGAQDQVIDASAMDVYAARIPQARTLLLPDAGHMTLMESPAEVADAVRSLIDDGSGA